MHILNESKQEKVKTINDIHSELDNIKVDVKNKKENMEDMKPKVKRLKVDRRGNKIKNKNVVVPKLAKKKRCLAIILKESKGTFWKWVPFKKDTFRHDENTYFILPDGAYLSDNRIVIYLYMEGISTPITHETIEKEQVEVKYTDANGNNKTEQVYKIKGLNYDSELIDMLLNRHLADEFTRPHPDIGNIFTYILIGVCICLSVGILGVLLS